MITVKMLKQYLEFKPDDSILTTESGEPILWLSEPEIRQGEQETIVLSTRKPIAVCAKCKDVVYKEEGLDYYAWCPSCDENLYEFETLPLSTNIIN